MTVPAQISMVPSGERSTGMATSTARAVHQGSVEARSHEGSRRTLWTEIRDWKCVEAAALICFMTTGQVQARVAAT